MWLSSKNKQNKDWFLFHYESMSNIIKMCSVNNYINVIWVVIISYLCCRNPLSRNIWYTTLGDISWFLLFFFRFSVMDYSQFFPPAKVLEFDGFNLTLTHIKWLKVKFYYSNIWAGEFEHSETIYHCVKAVDLCWFGIGNFLDCS